VERVGHPATIRVLDFYVDELARIMRFITKSECQPDGSCLFTSIDGEAMRQWEAEERVIDPERWAEATPAPRTRKPRRMTFDERVADAKQSMEDMLAKHGWFPTCNCERCQKNRARRDQRRVDGWASPLGPLARYSGLLIGERDAGGI
jgi:hypothetical protein